MKIPQRVPENGFYYHYKHDPNGPLNDYAYEVVGVGCHKINDKNIINELEKIKSKMYGVGVF